MEQKQQRTLRLAIEDMQFAISEGYEHLKHEEPLEQLKP